MRSIIIYATRYGSTAEVAKRLQNEIGDNCMTVNIMKETIPPLDTFDTVILGGSIYIGKVQKKLTAFITANLKQLLTKQVGLYICAGAQTQEERDKELSEAFPSDLLAHAIVKNVLGYAFSFEKMHFWDRFIMKKIKGNSVSVAEYNEECILQFAETLKATAQKPPLD